MKTDEKNRNQKLPFSSRPGIVNDCGLKPVLFLPSGKKGPLFRSAKKWAASAEANASGGAIFASAKMRPFAPKRESGSWKRVRSSAGSSQRLCAFCRGKMHQTSSDASLDADRAPAVIQ